MVRVPGDQRIDALYLRLDDELVDTCDGSGRAIGAQIFEVAAAGGVVLANAPGNGIADDKAMYPYVAEFIGYYLDERPLLESVPTYRTVDRPNAGSCSSGSASWSPSRSTGTAARAC